MLGAGVSFMLKSGLGVSSWDALVANLVIGLDGSYRIVNSIFSLIVSIIANLIQKNKFSIKYILPCVISYFIGFIIDIFTNILPEPSTQVLSLTYFIVAFNLIAIGLNIVTIKNYVIPAIDELCRSISALMKSSFANGKFVGEIFALMLSIFVGLAFDLSNDSNFFMALRAYHIGVGTIVYTLLVGMMISLYEFIFIKLHIKEAKNAN